MVKQRLHIHSVDVEDSREVLQIRIVDKGACVDVSRKLVCDQCPNTTPYHTGGDVTSLAYATSDLWVSESDEDVFRIERGALTTW